MSATGRFLSTGSAVLLLLAARALPAQPTTHQNTSQQTMLANSEIQEAAEHLSVMVECPDRLWPSYSWEEYQVVFIDTKQGQAVLWNDQTKKGAEGKPAISTPLVSRIRQLSPGNYQSGIYKGARTLLIARKQEQDFKDLIHLAIHEGFHKTGQSELPPMRLRGEFYPENWHARYLRRELMNSLRRAIKKKGRRGMAEAAYWRRRLTELHHDDVEQTRTIDLWEGTAEYMGKTGLSLALVGCGSSDDELFTFAARTIDPWTLWFNKTNESYAIGFMAGLLLQMRQLKGWQGRATRGEDLLDILLRDLKPRRQKENRKVADKFKEFYEKRNSALAKTIDGFVNKITSETYYVLAIPDSWRVGSYSTTGHVNFIFDGNRMTIALKKSSRFEKPGTSDVLDLHEQDAGFIKLGGTVPGDYIFFPIATEHLKREFDGSYSIHSEHVTASRLILGPQRLKGFTAVWLIAQ